MLFTHRPHSLSTAAADHGIKTYADLATLRLETANPPPLVVLVHNVGLFDWDATSTDTDNSISIIKVTAITTGRYIARM